MTYRETFTEAKTTFTIVTPTSGTALYIWQVVLTSEGESLVEFAPSGIDVAKLNGAGSIGVSNPDTQGADDEVLSITCPANTTVKVLYDEV